MDHDRIDRDDLVGQYRTGALRGPDLEAFETHLIACTECQDQLEADAAFARHLGVWGTLRTRSWAPQALAAAGVCALVLSGVMWNEWRQAELRVGELERSVAELGAPRADALVFEFPTDRAASRTRARLHLPRDVRWFTLELEVPATEGPCCALRVEDAGGRLVWEGEARVVERTGTVRVQLAQDSLPPGEYRALLSGRGPGAALLSTHPFEIVPTG